MKEECDAIPVACTLSDAELREREVRLLARFRSAVIATEELPDGYAFRIPGDDKWIGAVAELIAAERECCRFLTFKLTIAPNIGPVILRVTGPSGTKDFLRMTFCKRG
jgi:hypothetical protein